MMALVFTNGPMISAMGDTIAWIGSSGPQELDVVVVTAEGGEAALGVVGAFLRRLPPLEMGFDFVDAREREVTPALRALTRSLQ